MKAFEDYVDVRQFRNNEQEYREIISLGLGGETGEVLDLLKKKIRDGKDIRDELLLELGDVLHYLTAIAHQYDFTLQEVMDANIAKLHKRHGDG